jgi:DNA polymerase-3 subunit epsilon
VRRDQLVDRFESLVNCGVKIPPLITAYTGITQAMVDRAPLARNVIPKLLEFIGSDPIVAHNACFDRRFLESECAHSGQSARFDTFICSMRVARRVYPSLTSHALESLAKQLGVEYRGSAHRAGADAEVTAKLMVSLGRRLQSQYAGLPIDAALFKRIMKMPVAAAAKRLEVLALAAC